MGIAWTTRVLRRLSRPVVAAAEGFVSPCSDGWIREVVCCSCGFGQLEIEQGVAAHGTIELFRVTALPKHLVFWPNTE
jgi:hypothetical protein